MVLKDKTVVTFHAGILTIGGTVIEVAYNDARIFFDFGAEFKPELGITPEQESLDIFLENRMVPELPTLYDRRLKPEAWDNSIDLAKTAVFISHLHLDHTKVINYLDKEIPLYTLEPTKVLLDVLNKEGKFLTRNPLEADDYTRPMIGLESESVVQVGDIKVTLMPVDHDAYGATALIIETPDRKLTYTGDLRLHGYTPQDTLKMAAVAKGSDMLMMEGVSISWPEREPDLDAFPAKTEWDVIEAFKRLQLDNPDRQIVFNAYPGNARRWLEIVKNSPRTVVLKAEMAEVLKALFDVDVPYYGVSNILDGAKSEHYENLIKNKSKYMWQIEENFDILNEGALYIHSDAAPLGDFDPAYQPFLDMLAENKIEFLRLAVSGHAIPKDLDRIIELIEPKTLVPIHTLKPENLVNPYGDRILPTRGQVVVF
jgi:mRNA degradation ribonuclease J1/J2